MRVKFRDDADGEVYIETEDITGIIVPRGNVQGSYPVQILMKRSPLGLTFKTGQRQRSFRDALLLRLNWLNEEIVLSDIELAEVIPICTVNGVAR